MRAKAFIAILIAITGLIIAANGCSKSGSGSGGSSTPSTGTVPNGTGTGTFTWPTGTGGTGGGGTGDDGGSWTYSGGHATGTGVGTPDTNGTPVDGTIDLLQAVNSYRQSLGLNALVEDPSLTAVAQGYADYLVGTRAVCSAWDVTDADGKTPAQRISGAGISFIKCGEAASYRPAYNTIDLVMKLWVNGDSWNPDGYRDVLTDPDWTHCGLGHSYWLAPST
ncbi:MAG: CAP domain-containing protein [Planctomycetota bacterium]|jgi:hypothetical protein